MFAKLLAVGVLATSVVARDAWTSPNPQFGAMLPRAALDKRQGYYPSTSYCGSGDTCAEACGEGHETCLDTPTDLYCYDPTVGEKCCSDGNSCRAGYYCTKDPDAVTYCCPDGASLSDCAASYSLSVSLATDTPATSYPASSLASSAPVYEATSSVTVTSAKSYPTAPTSAAPTANGTYTGTTPPQFTGGAAKVAGMGMAVLAGAAGVAGLF